MVITPAILRARLARTKDVEKRIDIQRLLANALFESHLDEAHQEMTAMLQTYSAAENHRGIAQAQLTLGEICRRRGAMTEALEYYTQSIRHAEQGGHAQLRAEGLNSIAHVHRQLGNYHHSILLARDAFDLFDHLDSPLGKMSALQALSYGYSSLSDFKMALKCAQEGIEYVRQLQNKRAEASMLTVLANIYTRIGDFTTALHHHQSSYALNQQLGLPSMIASNLGNIGLTYRRIGQPPEEALSYLQKALEIQIEIQDEEPATYSYINLARCYFDMGDDVHAEENASIALDRAQKHGLTPALRLILSLFAELRLKQQALEEAKSLSLKALSLFEGNEIIDFKVRILELLVRICEQQKDAVLALQYQKLLTTAKQFENDQKNRREIAHMQMHVEVALMEQERESMRVRAMQTATAFNRQAYELSELASQLIHRRNLLMSVRQALSAVEMELASSAVQQIRRRIDAEVGTDNLGERVEALLAQLAPEFSLHLPELYPELSKTEIKICLFLKLKLSTVEISNLLSTSERTIEHHRLHIRKKMKLPPKINILDHLEKIGSQLNHPGKR